MRISDWSSDVCSSDLRVSKLESKTITDWMNKLASSPARLRTAKGADQNYREMVDSEEARRRRRSSTNRILTILKAALNVAYRTGNEPADDKWRRVSPLLRVVATKMQNYHENEENRLVKAC